MWRRTGASSSRSMACRKTKGNETVDVVRDATFRASPGGRARALLGDSRQKIACDSSG